jgi:hypothetical protein
MIAWLKRLWKGIPLKAPKPVKSLVLSGCDTDLDELQAHLESNEASVERLARIADLFRKS